MNLKRLYLLIFAPFVVLNSIKAIESKYILKEEIKGEQKTIFIDVNLDKKVDRIEKYEKESLRALEIDRDFSGDINEWIVYQDYKDDKLPIEIVKRDTNRDKKIDRIEKVYKNFKLKILIVVTEVDKNFDGKMDDNFSTHSSLFQQSEVGPCGNPIQLDKLNIFSLVSEVDRIKDGLNVEYYEVVGGYKIHKSCMNNWGAKEFVDTLKSGMNNGIQCLKKLAEDNNKNKVTPNGAYNNLKNLDFLLSSTKVTIVCNENSYDWKNTVAHASTKPGDVLKTDPKVKHPYLSINPNEPKNKTRASQKELFEMKQTLFHEQLHNLGIRHSEDIEFPYTCETCCMPSKEDKKELIDASCKICSGGYSGANDPKFIQDFITWGKLSYSDARVTKSVIKFLKENKGDKQGAFFLAESNAGIFNPLGATLASKIREKIKPLSKAEEEALKRSEEYKTVDFLNKPSVQKLAGFVADSMYTHYYEQDSKKMLEKIEANKSEIKALLNIEKTATGNDKYIYEGLKEQLKSSLVDVWIYTYGKNVNRPETDKAYKLLQDLNLL